MKLILDELLSTLSQQITVGAHDIQLYAVRPHVVRYQQPAGSLQVQIWDVNGKLIDSSEVIAISAIGSDNFWHGYQRFLISTELKAGTVYRIALASSGYSFVEGTFIGWALDYDLRKVPASYSPNAGTSAPLDLEIFESKEFRRAG